jgi:uncharacterized protein (TIGR03435 family)
MTSRDSNGQWRVPYATLQPFLPACAPRATGPEYTIGGHLVAKNMPLLKFIEFAYKPTNYQMQLLRAEMPSWSRDIGFDIEASAGGNHSKDEMRLMKQSLLATRFHMVI